MTRRTKIKIRKLVELICRAIAVVGGALCMLGLFAPLGSGWSLLMSVGLIIFAVFGGISAGVHDRAILFVEEALEEDSENSS